MLEIIVAAATLYVCPGEVYTDAPRAGCHPVQESDKVEFNTVPEAPEFNSKSAAPLKADTGRASMDTQSRIPAASAEECTMYEEWVKLSTKSGSLGARDLSPAEYERWTNLKQVFGNSPPPNCR